MVAANQNIRDTKCVTCSTPRCMCARVCVNTHPDLAELHLNLFGDNISPVLLSKKVPEYPSQKGIDPGLRLRGLLWAPAHLKDTHTEMTCGLNHLDVKADWKCK